MYGKWINIEIELAKSMNKKIIAIEPWGSERTSAVVKNAADKIVRWNTDSIVSAIRGYQFHLRLDVAKKENDHVRVQKYSNVVVFCTVFQEFTNM